MYFLSFRHGYTIPELRQITAGRTRAGHQLGSRRTNDTPLHKNSLLKVFDMQIGWAVKQHRNGQVHWVKADAGETGEGQWQWLWNPQVDTIEKLERILKEARRLGFRENQAWRWVKRWEQERMDAAANARFAQEAAATPALFLSAEAA